MTRVNVEEEIEVKPWVGILMGSDSDFPVMEKAVRFLEEAQVPYRINIASALRTPEKVARIINEAEADGVKVFIVGAGKAAHLPGVVASFTTRPVIGVPIKTPDLGGVDSLYSIVQMPSGVPVATVAIDGAKNAAVLAVQILALEKRELAAFLAHFKREMAEEVEKKDRMLQEKVFGK